ncbi:MAG TPA: signal recognition particle-docking protein FtsY [Firmicutes bacterium]|nr:signal recognition particle-docking protein FtsY [Bacillota bacterium]
MGLFSKISGGLKKTRESFAAKLNDVFKFSKIDDDLYDELEEILVTADVGVNTSTAICDRLRQIVKEEKIKEPDEARRALKRVIRDLLGETPELILNTKPSLILVIGVNGVGKTTTIGKLAYNLKQQGKKVILGAADTFRAAAIEQLQVWADRAGAEIVKHGGGSDPAAVVFDAISAAKSRGSDVVICDTAGRLHNKKNLMDELTKISKVVSRELPGADIETLLVLDASTGQNAVNQAREFAATSAITGIVLTKLDGTAKGGIVLAVKNDLGIPVKLIGVGEGIDDLQSFDADQFTEALFEG